MTKRTNIISKADIASEACAWIVQIEEGDLTSADQIAFEEWMQRSPAHRIEIKRLSYFSQELNVLTDMMPSLERAVVRRKAIRNTAKKRKALISFVLVAATVVFSMFASVLSGNQSAPVEDAPVLYATTIGGQRDVTLTDGSVVKLNTDTEVEVDFTQARRKIRLIKGEAFFQVAHNADRPFLVYAGDNVVRAVGTAFTVKHLKDKFEVMVTEGRVELKPEELNLENKLPTIKKRREDPVKGVPHKPIFLSAGETIAYVANVEVTINAYTEVVKKVSKREIERELSWQDGLLEFSDTPLHEVVADLSRYTTLKIEIADPGLKNLKFGGLFRSDELTVLFDTLEANFGIKVDYEDESIVRLSREISAQ